MLELHFKIKHGYNNKFTERRHCRIGIALQNYAQLQHQNHQFINYESWNYASKASSVTTYIVSSARKLTLKLHFKIKHSYNNSVKRVNDSVVGIALQNQAQLQHDLIQEELKNVGIMLQKQA